MNVTSYYNIGVIILISLKLRRMKIKENIRVIKNAKNSNNKQTNKQSKKIKNRKKLKIKT